MKYYSYQSFALLILICAAVFFVAAHYIDTRHKQYGEALINEINAQESKTFEVAKSVKSSRLTAELSEFVNDCSVKYRNRFDNSLDKLEVLTPQEIESFEPMFESCGIYFAKAKTALVYQLDQELQKLETLDTIAIVINQDNRLLVPLTTWREYYELEKKLALALTEQYQIQVQIKDLLKAGRLASDAEIQALVAKARAVSLEASTTTNLIDKVFLEISTKNETPG